jgi:hypothetical protein
MKLKRHRIVQVNFRASSKWLNLIRMLATLEGRSSSALMRELLILGLAQYVNIYYRTPQLVKEQQLRALLGAELKKRATEPKAEAVRKNDV